MNFSTNDELTRQIISKLETYGGCAYVAQLVDALKVSHSDVVFALSRLANQGVVYRDEKSALDYTKPLLTSKWCLSAVQKQVNVSQDFLSGEVIGVIVSSRMLRDLGDWLRRTPVIGLIDSLNLYLCNAKKSIKIAMPYIGESLGILTMTECLDKLKDVSFKIITEDKSKSSIEPLKEFLPKLEVSYATKRLNQTKIRGVHIKMIVIDDELAIIGTFNLTKYHILINYDIGIVIRGAIVKFFGELFDKLWEILSKSE